MASQLTEFHYHLTQGGRSGLFDFEDQSFDVKNIYNYYLRKVRWFVLSHLKEHKFLRKEAPNF